MMTVILRVSAFVTLAVAASAQVAPTRGNFSLEAAALFPAGGYKADEYSSGPALRAGYELRLHRYVSAEAGWTGAWMPGVACDRFGCAHPTYRNDLIDYGIRGIYPAGRMEISIGVGGGHIRFDKSSGDNYYDSALLQYSARATFAINKSGSLRVGGTIRAWRDLGRPIQEWVSMSAGVSYGLGRLKR